MYAALYLHIKDNMLLQNYKSLTTNSVGKENRQNSNTLVVGEKNGKILTMGTLAIFIMPIHIKKWLFCKFICIKKALFARQDLKLSCSSLKIYHYYI